MLGEHREIGKYISIIQRMNNAYLAKELCSYQIGCGQQFFLLQIYKNPGITLQELAFHGYYDKATATRAVRKLEQEAYVRTEVDAEDKRIRHIYVTEKGGPVIEKTREVLGEWLELILQGFSKAEREQAERYLGRMAANAHEVLKTRRERDEFYDERENRKKRESAGV